MEARRNEDRTRKRRMLSFLLSFLLMIGTFPGIVRAESPEPVWDGTTTDLEWEGAGTEASPYLIQTAEELAGLAQSVNGGMNYAGQFFKLTADLALDEDGRYTKTENVKFGTDSYNIVTDAYAVNTGAHIWTPIGTGTSTTVNAVASANYFAGTFDGNGHMVSGLYTNSIARVQGLFGCVSGTVKNLTVSGCVCAHSLAGGIAAYLNGGSISGCTNDAIVFADAGETWNGNIENGTSKAGAVGGITGRAAGTASVIGCINHGAVTCANSAKGGRTGGIIGLIDQSSDAVTVENNGNTGKIAAYQYTGGIAGMNFSTGSPISGCYNTGAVSASSGGSAYAGGIAALSNSSISNCYNTGAISLTMTCSANTKAAHVGGIVSDLKSGCRVSDCYNTGVIWGGGPTIAFVTTSSGAIVGTGYGMTAEAFALTNCYTTFDASATSYAYDATEDLNFAQINSLTALQLITETEAKGTDFVSRLNRNGSQAFRQDSTAVNGGYPVLAWQSKGAAPTLTGISVYTQPKTAYLVGETFDTTNLEIRANYSDETYAVVSEYTVSNTEPLTAADTLITVSGTYEGTAFSFDFSVVVSEAVLSSLEITKAPGKTAYLAGEFFDKNGMIVTAHYTNGTTAVITDYIISPDRALTTEDDTVTVSYADDLTKTVTAAITVSSETEIPDQGSTWDGETVTPAKETAENGSSGIGYYYIKSPSQLAWVAQMTAAGYDFSDKNIILEENLNLGNREWTPIGSASVALIRLVEDDDRYGDSGMLSHSADFPFQGSFDGGGNEITGLSVTGHNSAVGLFGYIGAQGALRNLTLYGSVSGNHFVGGAAAVCAGTVEHVTNRVVVAATGDYVGGIIAEALGDFSVADCMNEAAISNSSNTRSSGRVGGIVGRADTGADGTITRCGNKGTITGYQYIGGIIGGQFGNVETSFCYNTANLTGISFGKVYLGGIAGKLEGGTLSYCYNTGDLTDNHWVAGHIRAVGGIAGCEQNHNTGTAITDCYTTGLITLNTSNMTYGTNWIYMIGNISGGDSVTGANTMHYANCYYLENRIPQGQEDSEDYRLWADIYKANHLIWDTEDIESKTEDEMKASDFTEQFSTEGYYLPDDAAMNGGYPVLYWQLDSEAPDAPSYEITTGFYGSGTASVSAGEETAKAGDTVEINISDLASDKQVREVKITDAAGNIYYARTVQKDVQYDFIMPGREVTVTVCIENKTESEDDYTVTLPENTDAIWTVTAASSYSSEDGIASGSTVFIKVNKNADARMTSLEGVRVLCGGEEVSCSSYGYTCDAEGNGISGEYFFTMPAGNVSAELIVQYGELTVYSKTGAAEATAEKTYTRQSMTELNEGTLYYSGYISETEPMIGKAEETVSLGKLLNDAGVSFGEGDTLMVSSVDGMNLYFTYEALYGSPRYYYPHLMDGTTAEEKAAGKTAVDALLVTKGYYSSDGSLSLADYPCDTLNAYRFVFGQTETEFNNGQPDVQYKCVDKMPKYVNGITVIHPLNVQGDVSGDGVLNASDAGTLLLAASGAITLTGARSNTAEQVYGDGYAEKASTVLRYLIGLRDTLS